MDLIEGKSPEIWEPLFFHSDSCLSIRIATALILSVRTDLKVCPHFRF
jgi:hypothetical protein